MVNLIANYSVFSTFNLKSAYHQVEISPEGMTYTNFEANERLYEFKHFLMGVTNAVMKFQRAVNKTVELEDLEGHTWAMLQSEELIRKTMMRMGPDLEMQQKNIT